MQATDQRGKSWTKLPIAANSPRWIRCLSYLSCFHEKAMRTFGGKSTSEPWTISSSCIGVKPRKRRDTKAYSSVRQKSAEQLQGDFVFHGDAIDELGVVENVLEGEGAFV